MASLEGTTLGKYRVLEALGRGGMAQVYKAYHPQLDRYMAIKVLRSDLVEEQEFLNRFQREARAVSGLRHPNIVQVTDFDTQGEIYYMVMELLEGDTLRARLNEYRVRGQRMPLDEAARILKDVLSALSFAHGEGIIHRDVKPANIMLTKKGQAVLTDFGVAQIVGSTQYTVSGALMGTLNYMAPEQGLKGTCDDRSDIYSLGIVMYEMLTGYTPFDADTPLAILMKHLNDPLPLPTQIDSTIPSSLEKIVLKCLAKEPDDRFQSADAMAEALMQAADNLSSSERAVVSPPSGFSQQAVFSGTARGQITDHRFADADTDAGNQPNKSAPLPELDIETPITGLLSSLTDSFGKMRIYRISPLSGIFGGIGLFFIMNFLVAILSALSGNNIIARAWPIEVILLANFLALIGWGVQEWGLMIPSGILFGNSLLFAYSALTGRWSDWVFLWMLELPILWISIYVPVRVAQMPNASHIWTRMFGMAMTALCVTCSLATILIAFAASFWTA